MSRRAPLALAATMLAVAQPALAQTASGEGSLSIINPFTVAVVETLSFGRLQPQGNGNPDLATMPADPSARMTTRGVIALSGEGETPMIITIRGLPGHVYRITMPSLGRSRPFAYPVGAFTAWSRNSGMLGADFTGRLDERGTDVIRIGATLAFPSDALEDVYEADVTPTVSQE